MEAREDLRFIQFTTIVFVALKETMTFAELLLLCNL